VRDVPEPNAFADASLDRAAHRRTDDAWLAAALADPASRAVVVTADAVAVAGDAAVRVPLAATAPLVGGDEPILLGVEDGAALFGVDAGAVLPAGVLPTGAALVGLRDAVLRLGPADAGLLAYAQAILSWQRRHRFCGVCGARTASAEGGHARRCPGCGATSYPRTDPVAIVVVADRERDRLLLGRQAAWPRGRYSALAGFVEPAESLEDAVAREVLEESGVAVRDVRYRSSQPWPFPGSLMLGFEATYAGGDARPADGELEAVRWFERAEVEAAARDDLAWDVHDETRLLLPPRVAIARRLVDGWLSGR
jgi:NAD+ diphosphatase